MPRMKDCVSVRINDKKVLVQKRLILCNLNELYAEFQSEHEGTIIGFTKFTKLRPKHCVFAWSSGTHSVCVCVHHENVQLMLRGINLQYLTNDSQVILNDFRDCLKLTVCPDVTNSCQIGEYQSCPCSTKIKENFMQSFDEEDLEEVKFDSWQQADRCTFQTL